MQKRKWMVLGLGLLLGGAGCGRKAQAVGTSSAAPAEPSAAAVAKRSVARITFVDKQQACECTRGRVDKTWTALQAALQGPAPVPVTRVHADTQPEQVAPLQQQRAFITLPAVYLLDDSGAVANLLQGEVTEAAFRQALR